MDRLNQFNVDENLQQSDAFSFFSEVTLTINKSCESDRPALVDAILRKVTKILSLRNDVVLTETLRFLRNFVAGSEVDQNTVIQNEMLFELAIKHVIRLTRHLALDDPCLNDRMQLRCAVQFLGNLVTSNPDTKPVVWKKVMPLFKIWLEGDDVALRKYSAMLLYNCLLDVPAHREELLYSCPDRLSVICSLLSCTSRDECEWGLYTLENLLESPSFMDNFYLALPVGARLALLDILFEKLSSPLLQKPNGCGVLASTLAFVAKQFEERADIILKIGEKMPDVDDVMEPVEVVKLLEILGSASTKPVHQCHLQELTSLLVSAIVLLKSIHLAGKESKNFFTPVEKLSLAVQSVDDETLEHPANGFKKNLIRLIANLCWRHKFNQDMVRELDSIPLLLDCCKLDARNPFIIQWVVFAIRNLCEGNPENQQLIGSMELQQMAESSVLPQSCVQVIHDESGRLVARAASTETTSRVQCARDDIRDLMS